ncbi:ABC transporter permease [Marinospirillum perlucidum]|uniref:ABC transporter permease n=1 Tax=Marinospirillum perlucidum TaxID=1982602 RepID=UPI000DF1C0FB|nr:ABC transporter permease [Marinospirillum perlucidum]
MDWIYALSDWLQALAAGNEPWNSYARYLPQLLEGAWLTLKLVVLSGIVGILLALPLALMRTSKNPWLWSFPYAYIFFFRGTPLLVQIYLVYYGLSQFESLRSLGWLWDEVLSQPYWCAIITFSLHTAAYIAELFRGAIQSVPRGEIEAAMAVGLSRRQQYQKIILPRAFGMILPAYGNEVILMLKGSALASTITLLDLMGATRNVISRTYMNLEFFLMAGVIYLLIAALFIGCFRLLENYFNAHQKATHLPTGKLDVQVQDEHLKDTAR